MRHAWLLLLIAIVCLSNPAFADETKQVVVAELEGPNAAAIRSKLVAALASHSEIRVVSLEAVRTAVERSGGSMSEGEAPASVSKVGVAVIVDGKIKSGKTWTATIRLRGGASESKSMSGGSAAALADEIEKSAWTQLGPALTGAKSPPTGKKRIFVAPLSGPKAKTVQGYVEKALNKKKGVTLVSAADRKAAGVGDKPSKDELAKAAQGADVSLFVTGSVKEEKKKLTLSLSLAGSDGEEVDKVELEGNGQAGLKKSIDAELVKMSSPAIEKSHPPLFPEEPADGAAVVSDETSEETAETEETEGEGGGTEPKAKERASALEVGIGIRAFSRQLRYTDDIFDQLREYELGSAPAAFGWLRWYPASHFTRGVAAHFALVGMYERAFATKSKISGGEEYETSMSEWQVGLRGRIPFLPHELGIQATYGTHAFEVDDDPAAPLVPDTKYKFIRIGVDGTARISRVIIGAGFGYRIVMDAGEIESDAWFPRSSVGGVDVGVFGGYEIVKGVDILAGFDFRRYFYDMNAVPGDTFAVGGARDEYIAGWGGFGFRLPGAQ
jgi:hypothetical protein